MQQNALKHVAPSEAALHSDDLADFEDIFGDAANRDITSNTSTATGATRAGNYRTNRKRSRSAKRKTGGWRITSGIKTTDAFKIKDGIHCLERAGSALSAFVTLKPPNELISDRNRQDWCRRKAYNIRRKLKRHGLNYIALAIVEKPIGGKLHLHLLVHVSSRNFHLIKEMQSLPHIDVRPCHRKHHNYILKNRLPTHPDVEKELRKTLPRQKAAPFRGKRWFFSMEALNLIGLA